MTLTFPTMAEQALEKFQSSSKTISLSTIAKEMGAETYWHWRYIEHVFDDDTSLIVKGRGRAHKVEVKLP